jgi:hypothetical protein
MPLPPMIGVELGWPELYFLVKFQSWTPVVLSSATIAPLKEPVYRVPSAPRLTLDCKMLGRVTCHKIVPVAASSAYRSLHTDAVHYRGARRQRGGGGGGVGTDHQLETLMRRGQGTQVIAGALGRESNITMYQSHSQACLPARAITHWHLPTNTVPCCPMAGVERTGHSMGTAHSKAPVVPLSART